MRATIVDQRCFQSLAKVLMKSAHWAINNGSHNSAGPFRSFFRILGDVVLSETSSNNEYMDNEKPTNIYN